MLVHLLLVVPVCLALQGGQPRAQLLHPRRQGGQGTQLDILGSIHNFRRTLLELLSRGLDSVASSGRPAKPPPRPGHSIQLPPRPPVPADLARPGPVYSQPVLPALPPPHMVEAVYTVQQHLSQAFPHISSGDHFSVYQPAMPQPLGPARPIEDIDLPSSGAPVVRPAAHPVVHHSPSEAGALVNGPHSFVDSTRVHAGEQVAAELAADHDAVNHVLPDLWREDLVGIKSHTKEHNHNTIHGHGRRVRRRRRGRGEVEVERRGRTEEERRGRKEEVERRRRSEVTTSPTPGLLLQ